VTKEPRRPTAIIADDHAEVHPLLRRILEPEFDVVEDVLDGQALLHAALYFRPDLIVVDVLMPVMGGIEAVKRLSAQLSTVAVVFISTDTGEENVQRVFRIGARAFVGKASVAEQLLPAARAALNGQRFVFVEPTKGNPR
jgi:two-component system invasion response regulator UvrY